MTVSQYITLYCQWNRLRIRNIFETTAGNIVFWSDHTLRLTVISMGEWGGNRFAGYIFSQRIGRRIRLFGEYLIWTKKWTAHFEDVWQQSNVHYMNIDFEIWKSKQIRKASIFLTRRNINMPEMYAYSWRIFSIRHGMYW